VRRERRERERERESSSLLETLSRVSAPNVRNEGMEETEVAGTPAQVYCSGRSPVEGIPARDLEPTATHRLGLDIGG
jgi:hypothetical protein